MNAIALAVVLAVFAVSVRAWRAVPGRKAAEQFRDIFTQPWGLQLILDFFGLEIVLALWMITDAAAHGTWLSAIACLLAMPIFGSMAAASYWLLRVL